MNVGASEITAVFQDNEVVFRIRESRPWGMKDESREVTLKYEDVCRLPAFPSGPGLECDSEEESHEAIRFWLDTPGKAVAFDFQSVAEKNAGPRDETFHGPYLFDDEQQR